MDGICKSCGRPIHWDGKERKTCDDRCRQAKRREEQRKKREEEWSQLHAVLERLPLSTEIVNLLEELLSFVENKHSPEIVQLRIAIEHHLQCVQKTAGQAQSKKQQ